MGKGVPQVEATFLALGVFTYGFSAGFFMYWQRQGLCSLILVQHSFDGGVDDLIADTHELSCNGLQVTAAATPPPPAAATTTATIKIHHMMDPESLGAEEDLIEVGGLRTGLLLYSTIYRGRKWLCGPQTTQPIVKSPVVENPSLLMASDEEAADEGRSKEKNRSQYSKPGTSIVGARNRSSMHIIFRKPSAPAASPSSTVQARPRREHRGDETHRGRGGNEIPSAVRMELFDKLKKPPVKQPMESNPIDENPLLVVESDEDEDSEKVPAAEEPQIGSSPYTTLPVKKLSLLLR
ncbi:unnamed protein product [Linum tenue]|uniref:Uncharacterized protein n=1 Tax=Linum tenue TaxID=586396 RepID=A0AAV0QUK8_9ROSI|nr:unnamed protein product [Linum tenue]